jgi:hypothetical protein
MATLKKWHGYQWVDYSAVEAYAICDTADHILIGKTEAGWRCELLVIAPTDLSSYQSAVGHADTAAALGVPANRISVALQPGDVLLVAQLQGGRLPEGSTTLPEGFQFSWVQVTLV